MHSFRNEFFTCLFKIQNVQVIQNDVIKCCKMMSSNVAKWCHHIATSQQRGEIVFHVVILDQFNKIKFNRFAEFRIQTSCLAVSHSNHYTRMYSVPEWCCRIIDQSDSLIRIALMFQKHFIAGAGARFICTVRTCRIQWSCEGLTSIPQQIHWIQLKHLLLRLCTTCHYRI